MAKFRIVERNNKYYIQKRFLWCVWLDLDPWGDVASGMVKPMEFDKDSLWCAERALERCKHPRKDESDEERVIKEI